MLTRPRVCIFRHLLGPLELCLVESLSFGCIFGAKMNYFFRSVPVELRPRIHREDLHFQWEHWFEFVLAHVLEIMN